MLCLIFQSLFRYSILDSIYFQPPKQQQKGGKQPSKGSAKPKKEGASGSKAKKKKWSKGKVRDKLNNLCLFDKATYDKLQKEVPSYKLITPSVVSERLKIRASLARAALAELHQKGELMKFLKTPYRTKYGCSQICIQMMIKYSLLLTLRDILLWKLEMVTFLTISDAQYNLRLS